jgi:hypothetical protein
MRYNIGPVVRFYVAVGDMAIGDIVDFQSVSATAGIWDFSPTGPGNGFKHGSLQYDSHGKWTQTVYDNNTPRLTDLNDGLPPWVEAVVRLSIPIVQSAVRQAVILAIQNAITGLRYSYGPITFSSDGKSVSVSYRILQAALDASSKFLARQYSVMFCPLLKSRKQTRLPGRTFKSHLTQRMRF